MGRLSHVHAFVYSPDRLLVGSVDTELEAEEVAHAFILRRIGQTWDRWDMATRLAGHVYFDGPAGRTLLCVGVDGVFQRIDPTGKIDSEVDQQPHGPSALRHLRVLRLIGDYIYTAGMQRQVYRIARGEKLWSRYDEGMLVPWGDPTIAGLWDIDGFTDELLYASGLQGELWRHEPGAGWLTCDPPTNVGLYAVCCAGDEQVYVAGDKGLVLRGRQDRWQILTNDATGDAFWSMAEFQGVIYLVTAERGLYRLRGDEVVKVDLPFDQTPTMHRLHTDGNVLLAVGTRDVHLFDGLSWTNLAPPET